MQYNRVPPARRRRRRRRSAPARFKLILVVLAAALICALIFAISTAATLGFGAEKFYKGVYVNGVDLAGYTRSEGSALMSNLAESWLNADYTLTFEDRSWTFSPADFGADLGLEAQLDRAWNIGHVGGIFSRKSAIKALKETPVYFTSEITYDEALLDNFISSIAAEVYVEPVDAVVVCDIDQPRILTESSSGRQLDAETTREQLYTLMLHGSGDTALKVDSIEPAISSNELSGGLQVIAQCQTNTSTSTSKRLTNVKRALDYFNALTVYDGERISFNDIVGSRTTARGFVEAPEYSEGEVRDGVGGGVCQASTTLYGALLLSGIDIVERNPHSMTVGYTQPSFDAAVTNTSKDLVFENNSGSPIYIYTEVTKENATVTIYGARPDYRVALESVILVESIEPTAMRYEEDPTGEHAYYTDEYVLKSTGKSGKKSECWRVFYDWETGEEVSRTKMSTDTYSAGTSVYYVGIHQRQ